MVGLNDIRDWKADELEEIRKEYRHALQVLTSEGDDYAGLRLSAEDWTGEAAGKAMAEHDRLAQRGDTYAAGLSAIVEALAQAADAVQLLPGRIDAAKELARKYGFHVGDNGELTDLFEGKDLPKDIHPDDRARAKKQVTAELAQIVRTANDIDHELTSVFKRAAAGHYDGSQLGDLSMAAAAGKEATNLTPPDPPKHGTPAQNAAWWHTLSKNERDALVKHAPEKIGNLDGVPAAYRSAANMKRLPKLKSKLEQRLEQLRKELDQKPSGGDIQTRSTNAGNAKKIADKIGNAESKIKALNKIQGTMDRGSRQLIHLDTSKPLVQAALSNGNVDTAKNVAVFTPGFRTNVQDDLPGYDQKMSDLRALSERINPHEKTATVTWMGYQEPQGDEVAHPGKSVIGTHAAKEGGRDLASFNNGIDASRTGTPAGAPHLTGIGHSYGSTTTGYGLGHDTPVDDAVLLGSPGQGSDKLKVPDGHLYSEGAKLDAVPRLYGSLGPSPSFDYPNKDDGALKGWVQHLRSVR